MRVTASAPGKMVLMGDHAVVYGRSSLVTAVDLRYRASITPVDDDTLIIETPGLKSAGRNRSIKLDDLGTYNEKETRFVEAAIHRVFDHTGQRSGLHIITDGPELSYGLGSSSAVTAAVVAALLHLLDCQTDPRTVFDLAYGAVLDVQGKGSGVDLAAAVYGGTVYYRKGGIVLDALPIAPPPLVIGYSGAKVSTTSLIDVVAGLATRQQRAVATIFDLMGDLADDARASLLKNDVAALGDQVNIHQGLLEALAVGVPNLANLIYAARDAGAAGAKLSGAGGGDCMFAVTTPENRDAVIAALNTHGQHIDLALGAPGIRLEVKN